MKKIAITLSLAAALGTVFPALTPAAQADAQGDMVRALTAKYKASSVTLGLVLKSVAGGSEQAQLEVDGLVIDPSGLVVTTNTGIDPTSTYSSMMGDDAAGRMATKVVSVKIRLESGDELPGKVVLRDKDRNLAFVRPVRRPARPLTAVNFAHAGTARIGEVTYILGRQGRAGSRSNEAMVQRIVSVVQKPRLFYVLEPWSYMYMGDVVFNESGQPLGLVSIRVVRGGRSSFNSSDNLLSVAIPAADIMEVAAQAPQAKDVHDARPSPKPAKPTLGSVAPSGKPTRKR